VSPRPAAVRTFEQALADWLASFTAPESLAAEMADACASGAAWAAAIAGVAVRRVDWPDAEAIAWGLCVGGCAGALEAARRSLDMASAPGAPAASGPARPLLASDGLIAAAHETLGSLPPDGARAALAALAREFGDGGPWRSLTATGSQPAWVALVPCALGPAAEADPAGPWEAWAEAWRAGSDQPTKDAALWNHPAADPETRALLHSAADAYA
jgi:hypothetical protein